LVYGLTNTGMSGSAPGYMAPPLLIESQLSIAAVFGFAQSVRGRLASAQNGGARETVRADRVSVEGVALKSPDVELPNSRLFSKPLAVATFVEEAEQAATDKTEMRRFLMALTESPPPHASDQDWLFNWKPLLKRSASRATKSSPPTADSSRALSIPTAKSRSTEPRQGSARLRFRFSTRLPMLKVRDSIAPSRGIERRRDIGCESDLSEPLDERQ
jgi:hypothetical protein